MQNVSQLPVAIVGAGPVGLAAAANLASRGIAFRVYEAGASVGSSIREWSHVRIFTTWDQSVDPISRRLLGESGWSLREPDAYPTGGEIYSDYLQPLAALGALAPHIQTNARVTSISRHGLDKVASAGRAERPFELRVENGREIRLDLARAVIDASGTWHRPNPLGASGTEAVGERSYSRRIAYGMPDVLGRDRKRYAGKRVAVVGAGYSAANVLLDLASLNRDAGHMRATWVVRGDNLARVFGGGDADQLPARGRIGRALQDLVRAGRIDLVRGFRVVQVREEGDGLSLLGETRSGPQAITGLDEIIACTGQRPDLEVTRELRLDIDPSLESLKALAPLIDPNVHSCGTVPPHGHRELSHSEPGFYTIGAKSYGRAPTFLMLTGYEQARSVAAALAGDWIAADKVDLVLPETGICSTDDLEETGGCCGESRPVKVAAAGCCGGAPKVDVDSCCLADEIAKAAGKSGCGCGSTAAA